MTTVRVGRAGAPNNTIRGTAAGTVTALDPGDRLHTVLVV